MDEWRERLAGIDDDYLIGISNKGIVKRAYKDLEESLSGADNRAEIGALGEEAAVKVGGENVTVRFPLGESKCTCPSRSVCRHVVQAILVLREACLGGGTDSGDMPEECDSCDQSRNNGAEGGAGSPDGAVWKEIGAYSLDKLKKALGSRYFQSLAGQAAGGIRPVIERSSVVTVRLPEQGMVVKLLSPMEYSTCTCHKKELCRHKAAAILWCQLETGALSREALQKEAADAPVYDLAEVGDVAGQMERFLEELLGTGLSRVSPEVADDLERLAVISHNAQLASFEGYFRALSDSYGRYFARKAAFRTEDLMEQLTRLYRRVQLLRRAAGQEDVGKLAGEFRADYFPAGNLDLVGITMEHFRSQTGYEGETVYFLEETTKKWYTYTDARPVFYDDAKRRGNAGKSQARQAPWGLNLSFEDLLKVRIRLTGAKCDGRGRLSSSQETRGEVTGEKGLCISDIANWYYLDFGVLFRERIGRGQWEWLAQQGGPDESDDRGEAGVQLLFVQPKDCAKAEFSETEQLLTLPLYDGAGRELLVEVAYSRQESGTIRYLERISEKRLPCFLGKVYLRDGRLRMYPVDLLEIEAFGADTGPGGSRDADAEDNKDNWQRTDVPADARSQGQGDGPDTEESAASAMSASHRPKFLVMEDMAGEIAARMADLCQSGFFAVHDSTLKDLRAAAALSAQYGMEYLSGLLAALEEKLAANRHRMEQENGPLARIYTDINEYLYLLKQKNEHNRAESYYA